MLLRILLLIPMLACWSACRTPGTPTSDDEPTADLFQEPPIAARPRGLWDWLNGNASLPQLSREMEEARRMGMGGFDIWDVGTMFNPEGMIPDGPPFLSDQSTQAIAHVVREAERLGLEIGLTMSSSWNAGGTWVQPEHGAMGLFRSDTVLRGPVRFAGSLPFPQMPAEYRPGRKMIHHTDAQGRPTFFREVAVLAYPQRQDSASIAPEEIVHATADPVKGFTIDLPAGTWRLVQYRCIPTGQPLMIPSPQSVGLMLDHFSAEAQRMNIDYVIGRLQAELGPLHNRALKYLYTDSYEVNSAVWTPALPEEFRRRAGYDLVPFLPVLDGATVGDAETSSRFRFDFAKVLSDLIIENHYRLGRELCEPHGLGFHAEAGGPGQPIHNVPFEDLRAMGSLTAPRGEFWRNHPQLELLQIVKGPASAAHIYDQPYVEAESFTSVWLWQEGPGDLKPLADRALSEGLNRFYYHTFPHIPPEAGAPGWVYNFGTLINTTRAWWPKSRDFHYYIGRCSYLLQRGNFVGDVAYYYGDRAPNFVPPRHEDPALGPGYDYDVVNSEAILERMTVRDGRICLPHGQCYEVLVLPNERRASPEVLAKLETMVQAGAWIVGAPPQRSYRLHEATTRDAQVQAIAGRLWGPCDSVSVQHHAYGKGHVYWGKGLREVLAATGVGPDLSYPGQAAHPIGYIHRQTTDHDIYFLWNRESRPYRGGMTFRVKDRMPTWWDPASGQITPLPCYTAADGGSTVFVSLEAGGSGFVVFGKKQPVPYLTRLRQGRRDLLADSAAAVTVADGRLIAWQDGDYMGDLSDGSAFASSVRLPAAYAIAGGWNLYFPHGWGAPPTASLPQLQSWHEHPEAGIRYFSGTARYEKAFDLPAGYKQEGRRLYLDLGAVEEVAEVWLNGHALGTRWHAPFRYDVTDQLRTGTNYLIVEVANTLNNQLVGDAARPTGERRTRSNISRLPNAWSTPMSDAPLLPSGLLGPVQIVAGQVLWPQ
ncbi:MAG: hypothetical protein OHK0039_24800 [Bacteroidia bacterium]